jgi:ABC-2 type transport system ATP-binding protein
MLFFDEISAGLDPQARRNMWELVQKIRAQGKTIFLTTHYMEEAEYLCDRVGVIDGGRIIALDTPQALVSRFGHESKVRFKVAHTDLAAAEFEQLQAVTRAEKADDDYVLYARDETGALQELLRFADARQIRLSNIRTETPDLDDVFLALTGKALRE